MANRWRQALRWAAVLLLVGVGAEAAARLDDWIHDATPLLASPSRDRDLVVAESWGYRGRPHGAFRKWWLNAFGFRGPEIAQQPPSYHIRILILGASETFGLYESPDHEYPARLRARLASSPEIEVVNAAMAGISVKSCRRLRLSDAMIR